MCYYALYFTAFAHMPLHLGDYDRELEADIISQRSDFSLDATSLCPPPMSFIEAEEESAVARVALAEARLTAAIKSLTADQACYTKYIMNSKHTARSEHQAKVFHSRAMKEMGRAVTQRWCEKHCMVAGIKDAASTVPLVTQARCT